jgi:hypothetical protein
MNSKLISVATLFAAGAAFNGAPTLGAHALDLGPSSRTLLAAACGGKDAKDGAQATPPDKAKQGSCAKGSCGKGRCGKSHAKKDGACGKDKKDAPSADNK